jgi:malate synthase
MTMDRAFLRAYSLKLIQTCHRRRALALGGMAAQIPIKGNPAANEEAFARVRADKEREAGDGHDGTWVAHPDLVAVAMEVFNRLMPHKNQLERLHDDIHIGENQMREVHCGERTEQGLRENIRVGIQYIEAWLGGRGAVPLYNLMEDAATAEICRAQIWQWLQLRAKLADGRVVKPELFNALVADETNLILRAVTQAVYDRGHFREAVRLFSRLCLAPNFEPFLTLPAYEALPDHPRAVPAVPARRIAQA